MEVFAVTIAPSTPSIATSQSASTATVDVISTPFSSKSANLTSVVTFCSAVAVRIAMEETLPTEAVNETVFPVAYDT